MKKSKADTAETCRRIVEIASKALRSQGTNMTGENAEWACRDRVDSTTVRRFVTVHNLDLFPESAPVSAPPGFDYRRDFIGRDEELALVAEIEQLDLTPYEFRGIEARRRVISCARARFSCMVVALQLTGGSVMTSNSASAV